MPTITLPYGIDSMSVEVPDSSVVVELDGRGEPSPVEDPAAAVRRAVGDPLGMPPLRELVTAGSKVAIAFPDQVKGGNHERAHRLVTLPIVLDVLSRAGVRDEDITLVCAIGLHRKNTREEMAAYLPRDVLNRFGPDQLVNHDAEDPEGIVDLGTSAHGDPLQFNRACAEADLCIVLGHVQGNPYGGFSGGHKTYTTGLTSWRSIAGHHVPSTMHRRDFLPINTSSHFRSQLKAIGNGIQQALNKSFFVIDAVVGHGSEILNVVAGRVDEVEKACWPLARRRTDVELDIEPADILVFGLPRDFHYGPGMGTNPILMAQAIAAVVARAAGAFREGGVAIAVSKCDGWFNEEWFPSYEETYRRYQQVVSVGEMTADAEELSARPEYVDAYRNRHAYHPFHAFSMLSFAEIARQRCSRIFIPGAEAPGYARGLGLEPTRTFDAALDAAHRYLGAGARVLALPNFLSAIPPHLFASRDAAA